MRLVQKMMRATHRDLLVGSLLLAFGVVWSVTVYVTIPTDFSESVGPRAFPLALGIALVLLSGLLLISSIRNARETGEETQVEDPDAVQNERIVLKMVGAVFVTIMAYGFLMEKVGFVIATLTIVSTSMWLILGIRKPASIATMAVGITFGCWLVFGKILGAYLPPGTWLSLF